MFPPGSSVSSATEKVIRTHGTIRPDRAWTGTQIFSSWPSNVRTKSSIKQVAAVRPRSKQARCANICSQRHDLHILALLLRQLACCCHSQVSPVIFWWSGMPVQSSEALSCRPVQLFVLIVDACFTKAKTGFLNGAEIREFWLDFLKSSWIYYHSSCSFNGDF